MTHQHRNHRDSAPLSLGEGSVRKDSFGGERLHTHGAVDPTIFTSDTGIRAIKLSFLILFVTAAFQVVIVYISGSIALLADTIHNFGDAATAIPLAVAFTLAKRKPTRSFTYGYGRVEDFAGVMIVLIILTSAIVAGYESIDRFFHMKEMTNLGAVAAASIVGFAGNEIAAVVRIRTGKQINSAALVADGYHARTDALTSLAVLVGVIGTWLGYPIADAIIGLVITVMILKIVCDSGKTVFSRMLDGVSPEILDEINHAARHIHSVADVTDIRARWLGHRLHAELNISVKSDISVKEGHRIAMEVQQELRHHLSYLSNAVIHVDPADASGENHHVIRQHASAIDNS